MKTNKEEITETKLKLSLKTNTIFFMNYYQKYYIRLQDE